MLFLSETNKVKSMAKVKTVYACSQCGAQHPKWNGQCGDCGAWNSLAEETSQPASTHRANKQYAGKMTEVTSLADIAVVDHPRIQSSLSELDRALGGGVTAGSVTLLGGDPGIGKSTLLLQLMCDLADTHHALYVTGEESLQQISARAKRLNITTPNLHLLADTQIERILIAAEKVKPQIMVIDSIQTIFTDFVSSAPGSVSQVRESTAQLVRFAKHSQTAIFIVGHVTKEGAIAGPRVLEHMVDTVLYFEGEPGSRFRLIRAVKNRFGAVNELGIFAMTETGLKAVSNPSAIFMNQASDPAPGNVVLCAWEGSRPLLVEIQALVDQTYLPNPRRVTVGLEHNRLNMLLAVLHRHAGIATYNQDVFVNAVGGIRVLETSADLAIIASIVSSLKNKILPRDLIVFGEVGLGGEIRPVPNGQERLIEAAKHGFKRAIVPKANAPKKPIAGLEINAVTSLQGALDLL
jgi:DNA repair protein RadA/Sms